MVFLRFFSRFKKKLEISNLGMKNKSRNVYFFLPKLKIYLEINSRSRDCQFEIYLEIGKEYRDIESRDEKKIPRVWTSSQVLEIWNLVYKSRDLMSRKWISRFFFISRFLISRTKMMKKNEKKISRNQLFLA